MFSRWRASLWRIGQWTGMSYDSIILALTHKVLNLSSQYTFFGPTDLWIYSRIHYQILNTPQSSDYKKKFQLIFWQVLNSSFTEISRNIEHHLVLTKLKNCFRQEFVILYNFFKKITKLWWQRQALAGAVFQDYTANCHFRCKAQNHAPTPSSDHLL